VKHHAKMGSLTAPRRDKVARYQHLLLQKRRRVLSQAPLGGAGRGIVTCGGGITYLPCVWVLVSILRQLKCELPIECWYLDSSEMDEHLLSLLCSRGVSCINASVAQNIHPVRVTSERRGWQLKPYAIIQSAFNEVLFIDADNVPTRNPEYLFDTQLFRQTGCLFWPDRDALKPHAERHGWPSMWEVCGLPFESARAFETGQILVDKAKCPAALRLAMHFNEHADFYYNILWGDKDTFQFAFRLLRQPFSLIPIQPSDYRGLVLFQHDPDRSIIFQHRNGDKWSWKGLTHRIPGFLFEQDSLDYIDELRRFV
jgi:hypothetical protein